MGRKIGISVEKLQALSSWQTDPRFDELERLALALGEAMARTPVVVPDELFASLRARLSEAQLVELATAIAWENFRARFNCAFEVESDGLTEGAACLIPARS